MKGDTIPVALVAALVITAVVWNTFVGLSFSLPFWRIAIVPVVMLGVAVSYRVTRPAERRLFEVTLYMALWILFPIFGIELTYLGLAAGYPFRDEFFTRADQMLGFDWVACWRFIEGYPWLRNLLAMAYLSSFWQPFVIVLAVAYWRAGGRNAEFLTAILLALAFTIIGATLWPAVGPLATYGLNPYLANFIANLRSAHPAASWYMGVICFPSFHTAMAILFTWANRGLKTFWIFAGLNLLMLVAVPTLGNHYLIDLVGGALVSAAAIWMARRRDWSPLRADKKSRVITGVPSIRR